MISKRWSRVVIRDEIAAALGGTLAPDIEVPESGGTKACRRSLVFAAGDARHLPESMASTFTKKGVVEVAGASLLPELAVVRLFTRAGWQAYW